MRQRNLVLTGQELEIMKIIWARGHATVRDVYEVLLENRKVAYTTVMTMMGILDQKGHLKKRQVEGDRAYLYTPAKPQQQVIGSMVRDFVNRVFNGSAEPLLLHLLDAEQLSAAEIEEIAKKARRAEKKR
jgi:BlaI family transcriptional regulator, penicillinase repressor